MKRLALIVVISFLLVGQVFADAIVLKSGKRIEGKVTERTKDYVKLDFQDLATTYFSDQIQSVETDVPESVAIPQKQKSSESSQAADQEALQNNELFKKMKSAQSKIARTHTKMMMQMDAKDAMNMKLEQISDADWNNRIMHSSTEAKEIEYVLPDKEAMEARIEQAEQSGVSPDQIEKMQSAISAMPEMMKGMAELMKKSINGEFFLVGTKKYIRMGSKWFQMDKPQSDMDAMWKMLISMRNGEETSSIDSLSTVMPEANNFGDMLSQFSNLSYKLYDFNNVIEADFQGEPCFVLNFKTDQVLDMLNKSLSDPQVSSNPQLKNIQKVDSYSGKMFVSKDSYLVLGVIFDMSMSGSDTQGAKKMNIKGDVILSYPSGSIETPQEANNATPVSGENELKEMLTKEFMTNLQGSMPGLNEADN